MLVELSWKKAGLGTANGSSLCSSIWAISCGAAGGGAGVEAHVEGGVSGWLGTHTPEADPSPGGGAQQAQQAQQEARPPERAQPRQRTCTSLRLSVKARRLPPNPSSVSSTTASALGSQRREYSASAPSMSLVPTSAPAACMGQRQDN